MSAYGIATQDLSRAFSNEHFQMPGGFLVGDTTEYLIKLDMEFHRVVDLERLIVSYRDGSPIRLADVASVEDGLADNRRLARYNDQPAVGLGIVKVTGANTVAIVDAIEERLANEIIPRLPPGMKVSIASNDATLIKALLALLRGALRFRWLVVVLTVGAVYPSGHFLAHLGKGFLPQEDEGKFVVSFKTPLGSSLDYTDGRLREIEATLENHAEVAGYLSAIGTGQTGQANRGNVLVRMTPRAQRDIHMYTLIERLRAELAEIPGVQAFPAPVAPLAGQRGEPLQFVLLGPDIKGVARLSNELQKKLAGIPELGRVDLDLRLELPQLSLGVDRTRAAAVGLSTRDIALAVNVLASGLDRAVAERVCGENDLAGRGVWQDEAIHAVRDRDRARLGVHRARGVRDGAPVSLNRSPGTPKVGPCGPPLPATEVGEEAAHGLALLDGNPYDKVGCIHWSRNSRMAVATLRPRPERRGWTASLIRRLDSPAADHAREHAERYAISPGDRARGRGSGLVARPRRLNVLELALTPERHLVARARETGGADPDAAWSKKIERAFSTSREAGLFTLAAARPVGPVAASVTFWRGLAARYLTELCRMPQAPGSALDPIEPPAAGEIADLLLGAPPMPGGEYLSPEVVRECWEELDAWARDAVAASGAGLGAWLKAKAAMWHPIGRVCFHLAENKRDPDYPFAFLATYAAGLSRDGRVQYQALGKALEEYAGARNRKALVKLLSPVNEASARSGLVKELVDSGDLFHPLAWTPREAYRFLTDVPRLEESGLLVRVPDWWRRRPRPRVAVTIGESGPRHFGADAMLDFQVGLALGDDRLTRSEWRRLMASEEGLVQLRGQWVELDRERLRAALDHWKRVEAAAGEGGLSFIEGMRLLAGAPADLDAGGAGPDDDRGWSAVTAGRSLSEILSRLRAPESIAEHAGDALRNGTLRPYQAVGRDWLWLLANLGLGACLADDMGLGKTIQVLALLLALKAARKGPGRPSLLVLPASLLANWKSEIERFAPSLAARFVHPSELAASALEALAERPEEALAGCDLVVTSYGMLLRQEWLLGLEWHLAILDEAQAIKNPAARQTRAVKRLRAQSRIALTGTPIENRLSDLWSLFDFLCPGLLGSAARFKRFVKGLEQRERDRYAPLRCLVQPYILRRLKTDRRVIADLPEKTEMKAFCGLSRRQAALYAQTVEELRVALEERTGIERRGLVLATLMRLKQICNHPSQILGDGRYEPRLSGKFERLRAIGEEIASREERALVFTQFRELTEPLAAFLGDVFGREGLVLHGATAVRRRQRLVDTFQRDGGPPFLVLSLKAGGVGLNLTAASHVVHFDRWWNPAVEAQATDRAFRIGQERNVMVHKFVCRGTVEERIDALIEEKRGLSSDLLEAGAEARLTELSNEELLGIVALDVDSASV